MEFKKIKIQFFSFAVVIAGFLFWSGCGKQVAQVKPITLEYWGVWNEGSDIEPVIAMYKKKYPQVKINYKKLRFDEYQNELLTAWAQDKGPDIFSIPNSWVYAYKDFIVPMPASTTMLRKYQKTSFGGARKQTVVEKVSTAGYTPQTLGQKFLDVVSDDVVVQQGVYGLPLSMDTLALFYNKALLAQSGAAQPPATWSDFVQIIPKLTLQDTNGKIVRSAVSLGTVKNVDRAPDILAALMLQNGTGIIEDGKVTIASQSETQKGYYPGARALEFYTDFSQPTKQVYTWNDEMPNNLEAFAQGNLAFFLGYSYDLPLLASQAEGVDFGVTTLPQISEDFKVNYANYWVETVAKSSKHGNEAWDFLRFATNEDTVQLFLEQSHKPTALRGLVTKQAQENFDLAPFILQGVTAKSWYHGRKPEEAEDILENTITKIIQGAIPVDEGKDPYQSVLGDAAKKLQITL